MFFGNRDVVHLFLVSVKLTSYKGNAVLLQTTNLTNQISQSFCISMVYLFLIFIFVFLLNVINGYLNKMNCLSQQIQTASMIFLLIKASASGSIILEMIKIFF